MRSICERGLGNQHGHNNDTVSQDPVSLIRLVINSDYTQCRHHNASYNSLSTFVCVIHGPACCNTDWQIDMNNVCIPCDIKSSPAGLFYIDIDTALN